jgi:hypothetical protein
MEEAVSLWIRRINKSGRHFWLIDTHPVLLLAVIPAFIFAAVAHPELLAKTTVIIMGSGIICLTVAKISLFRQGIWISWGPRYMTKLNALLYKTGYALLGSAVVLMLLVRTVMR